MTDKDHKQLEEDFRLLSEKLDAPEYQKKVEQAITAALRPSIEEHRRFLRASWAKAHTRVVYR